MWKEINRRCDTDAEEELDLTLSEAIVFVAEITGEEDGETVYCTACWAPFMPDFYAFEVTREPLYDYLVNLDLEDNGNMERIRAEAIHRCEADEEYEGPYSVQFHALLQMLSRKANEVGYRTETYDRSDDLDDL